VVHPPDFAFIRGQDFQKGLDAISYFAAKGSFSRQHHAAPSLPLFGLIVFGGVALALAALVAAGIRRRKRSLLPRRYKPSAARHETRTGLQEVIEFPNANEIAPRVETIAPRSGGYSNVTTVTMQPSTGLTIQATFDSSITGDPNAAAIEAMINRAIAIYESLFSDPITINILFRYSTTGPEPSATPYPAGVLATSLSTVYTVSGTVSSAL